LSVSYIMKVYGHQSIRREVQIKHDLMTRTHLWPKTLNEQFV